MCLRWCCPRPYLVSTYGWLGTYVNSVRCGSFVGKFVDSVALQRYLRPCGELPLLASMVSATQGALQVPLCRQEFPIRSSYKTVRLGYAGRGHLRIRALELCPSTLDSSCTCALVLAYVESNVGGEVLVDAERVSSPRVEL